MIFLLCQMNTVSLNSNDISVVLHSHPICIDLPSSDSLERTCFCALLDWLGRISISLLAEDISKTSTMVKWLQNAE